MEARHSTADQATKETTGTLDQTRACLYNRARMIEVRNGSNEVDMQLYHGTQYIDELVGARLPDGPLIRTASVSDRPLPAKEQ